jgi:hypothetical protein
LWARQRASSKELRVGCEMASDVSRAVGEIRRRGISGIIVQDRDTAHAAWVWGLLLVVVLELRNGLNPRKVALNDRAARGIARGLAFWGLVNTRDGTRAGVRGRLYGGGLLRGAGRVVGLAAVPVQLLPLYPLLGVVDGRRRRSAVGAIGGSDGSQGSGRREGGASILCKRIAGGHVVGARVEANAGAATIEGGLTLLRAPVVGRGRAVVRHVDKSELRDMSLGSSGGSVLYVGIGGLGPVLVLEVHLNG